MSQTTNTSIQHTDPHRHTHTNINPPKTDNNGNQESILYLLINVRHIHSPPNWLLSLSQTCPCVQPPSPLIIILPLRQTPTKKPLHINAKTQILNIKTWENNTLYSTKTKHKLILLQKTKYFKKAIIFRLFVLQFLRHQSKGQSHTYPSAVVSVSKAIPVVAGH